MTDTEQRSNDDKREQLFSLLRDLSSVMMISSATGQITAARARPMSIARVDPDGTLYFLTSVDTSKVDEVQSEEVGMCTGQSKTQYVSLVGRFQVVRDRALVEELWSKMADAWFPQGKDDPRVRVLIFRPSAAELWDMSGAKGVGYLIDVAKAILGGAPPKENRDVHATVDVSHR